MRDRASRRLRFHAKGLRARRVRRRLSRIRVLPGTVSNVDKFEEEKKIAF